MIFLAVLITIMFSFGWGVLVNMMMPTPNWARWQRWVVAGAGGFMIGYWIPQLLLS